MVSFFAFCFFVIGHSALAATYCLDLDGSVCHNTVYSLEDFVEGLPTTGNYYPAYNHNIEGDWLDFTTTNYHFHVPLVLIEDYLDNSGIYSNYQWNSVDKDRNLVHDSIDEIVEVFEEVYVDYFGSKSKYKFKKWDGKLDVYISYDPGNNDSYGYYSSDGYLVVDPRYTSGEVEATIVHELFHVIEENYIGEALWDGYGHGNFIEGMAVLMEGNILTWEKGYLVYLDSAPNLRPEISIFTDGKNYGISDYGAYIWYLYLYQNYGTDFVKNVLEAYSEVSSESVAYRGFLAVDKVLKEKESSSVKEAYLGYVTWNYDYSNDKDGDSFNPVTITKSHSKLPVPAVSVSSLEAPSYFGSNYVEFDVRGIEGSMEVEFTGNLQADYYLSFLSVENGYVDYDNRIEYFVEKGGGYPFVIPNLGDYDKVVMVVSVVDVSGSDFIDVFSDFVYPYSYSAKKIEIESIIENEDISLDIDLSEYFVLDAGMEWGYEGSLVAEEEVVNLDNVVISKECGAKDGCVKYVYEDDEFDLSLWQNSVSIFTVNGRNIKKVKLLSDESFEIKIEKDAYVYFGLDPKSKDILDVKLVCNPYLKSLLEFNGGVHESFNPVCELAYVDSVGSIESIVFSDFYVKGFGLVRRDIDYYYDGVKLAGGGEELVSTNFADIKLEEAVVLVEEDVFSDLKVNDDNFDAINYLYDLDVVSGYSDGTFKPTNAVNRAELLKILVEGNGVSPSLEDYSNCFSDVTDDWYVPYVCYAKDEGWVDGYPDGTFKPAQTVNKVEAIKMLLNSKGVEVPEVAAEAPYGDVGIGEWFTPFIYVAKGLGILEESGAYYGPAKGMTRGGIAENLYRLLIL
ncbi:S-layer homology domain-containing protein [Candidatus Gracilibacteria bacterium]|nr:S-layer homology domain-containing protein [Candidatus Gracilibacteria bacterium]